MRNAVCHVSHNAHTGMRSLPLRLYMVFIGVLGYVIARQRSRWKCNSEE